MASSIQSPAMVPVTPKQQFKSDRVVVTNIQKEVISLEETIALVTRKTNSTSTALGKLATAIRAVQQSVKAKSSFGRGLSELADMIEQVSKITADFKERSEVTSLPLLRHFPTVVCPSALEALKRKKDSASALQGKIKEKSKVDLDEAKSVRSSKAASLDLEMSEIMRRAQQDVENAENTLEEFDKKRKETIQKAAKEFIHAQLVYHTRAIEALTVAWKAAEHLTEDADYSKEKDDSFPYYD